MTRSINTGSLHANFPALEDVALKGSLHANFPALRAVALKGSLHANFPVLKAVALKNIIFLTNQPNVHNNGNDVLRHLSQVLRLHDGNISTAYLLERFRCLKR
jgi:hypothetical protein